MFNANISAMFVDEAAAAHDNMAPMSQVDFLSYPVESVGQKRIIRVQKAPDRPCSQPKAFIDRICLATIRLRDHVQMGIALEDIQCAVSRAAVHDNMLDIGVLLGEDTFNRLSNVLSLIERRRHDGDTRPLFHRSTALLSEGCLTDLVQNPHRFDSKGVPGELPNLPSATFDEQASQVLVREYTANRFGQV